MSVPPKTPTEKAMEALTDVEDKAREFYDNLTEHLQKFMTDSNMSRKVKNIQARIDEAKETMKQTLQEEKQYLEDTLKRMGEIPGDYNSADKIEYINKLKNDIQRDVQKLTNPTPTRKPVRFDNKKDIKTRGENKIDQTPPRRGSTTLNRNHKPKPS